MAVFGCLILISIEFYDFLLVFSLVLGSIDKILYIKHSRHTFKDLEVHQKCSVTRRILNSLLGIWKCGQTRSFSYDTIHLLFHFPKKNFHISIHPSYTSIMNHLAQLARTGPNSFSRVELVIVIGPGVVQFRE